MENSLILDGVKYISSKQAAEVTGYAKDYVGQMCRAGKIDAKLVGRNWFVSERSLLNHKEHGRGGHSLSVKENARRDEELLSHVGISYTRDIPLYRVEVDERPLYPELQKSAVREKENAESGQNVPVHVVKKERVPEYSRITADVRPRDIIVQERVGPIERQRFGKESEGKTFYEGKRKKIIVGERNRIGMRFAFAVALVLLIVAASLSLEGKITYVQGEQLRESSTLPQISISANLMGALDELGNKMESLVGID